MVEAKGVAVPPAEIGLTVITDVPVDVQPAPDVEVAVYVVLVDGFA